MFEIKFLKDCYDCDYSEFLNRDLRDLSLNDQIETLALVSDGVIYDYGPVISYSDSNGHVIRIFNHPMNNIYIFFGELYLFEYTNLNALNDFFQRFIAEL